MIYTHWLELPLSRTYFHSPKGVRAIEVSTVYTTPRTKFQAATIIGTLKSISYKNLNLAKLA